MSHMPVHGSGSGDLLPSLDLTRSIDVKAVHKLVEKSRILPVASFSVIGSTDKRVDQILFHLGLVELLHVRRLDANDCIVLGGFQLVELP